MDEYKVAVYGEITGLYRVIKNIDNYYDGVIETIATALARRRKVVLIQNDEIIYTYDNRR